MLLTGFPAGPLAANCYVLAASAGGPCVVVDPGQQSAEALDRVLAEHRLSPEAVLLTHGHFDHVAGAREVCDRYEVPARLGAADEYMLDDPMAALSAELRAGMTGLLAPGEDLTALRPDRVEPWDGDATVELAGLRIEVIAVPGHTGGSVTYRVGLDQAGGLDGIGGADGAGGSGWGDVPEVLLTGDTLFAGSIGRTDLPGGSSSQILASIREKLLTRPDAAVILPGHGPASTIGAERAQNPFLA